MEPEHMDTTSTTTTAVEWEPFKLAKTVINTITQSSDDACYVTGIAVNNSLIATSNSNNIIKLYNIKDYSLEGELVGHTNTINKIFFKKTKPTELMSCSSDKTICVWDTIKKTYIKYWSSPKEVWTMAINAAETLLASACDTDIYIWNLNNYSMNRIIHDQHSMEITWLQFHPNFPNYLICVTDITIMKDEDYTMQTFNFEQSILNFQFYGDNNFLSSISQIGTFAIWDLVNEQLIHNFGHLREILTNDKTTVDYVIKSFFSQKLNKLILVAGSFGGDIYIYLVDGTELKLIQHLSNAHSDIVRDVFWNEQANTLFTVGEDSRFCVWKTGNNVTFSPPSGPSQATPDKDTRKKKKHNKAAPY